MSTDPSDLPFPEVASTEGGEHDFESDDSSDRFPATLSNTTRNLFSESG